MNGPDGVKAGKEITGGSANVLGMGLSASHGLGEMKTTVMNALDACRRVAGEPEHQSRVPLAAADVEGSD